MKTRIALAILAVSGLTFFLRDKPCADFTERTLQTPVRELTVAVRDTSEEQAKGLGGCKYIPKYSGMYFVFSEPALRTFWMKDMLLPIDIIWIQQGVVVGIEKNVPNMPPRTPDSKLPRYTSTMPVDGVLEVPAGKAGEYGIRVGSELNIDKKEAVSDTSPIL